MPHRASTTSYTYCAWAIVHTFPPHAGDQTNHFWDRRRKKFHKYTNNTGSVSIFFFIFIEFHCVDRVLNQTRLQNTPRAFIPSSPRLHFRVAANVFGVYAITSRSVRHRFRWIQSVGLGYSLRKVAPHFISRQFSLRNFSSVRIKHARRFLQGAIDTTASRVCVWVCMLLVWLVCVWGDIRLPPTK